MGHLAISHSLQNVHVWVCLTDPLPSQEVIQDCRALLSTTEKASADRFVYPNHGHTYVLAHALVRNVLAHHLKQNPTDFRFGKGEHGRPFLLGASNLNFNLSHTHGLAACAIYQDSIGVDVEKPRNNVDVEKLGQRVLTNAERETLDLTVPPGQSRFFDYWTIKEAYSKARGLGITMPFGEIDFRINADSMFKPSLEKVKDTDENWFMQCHNVTGNFRLAVAARKTKHTPVVFIRLINPLTMEELPFETSLIAKTTT